MPSHVVQHRAGNGADSLLQVSPIEDRRHQVIGSEPAHCLFAKVRDGPSRVRAGSPVENDGSVVDLDGEHPVVPVFVVSPILRLITAYVAPDGAPQDEPSGQEILAISVWGGIRFDPVDT